MNLLGTSSRLIFVFAGILLLFGLSPQNSSAQTQTAILLSSPTPVGPSPKPTGLDQITVISSKTLTLSCPATPVASLSSTTNGSGYVLVDNYITLSVNGNLVTNPNTDSTPFSPAGNVCTGGVTDGFNSTTQQDCFSGAYRANVNSLGGQNPDDFASPDNNNSVMDGVAGGVPPISVAAFLTPNATSTITIQAQDAGGF